MIFSQKYYCKLYVICLRVRISDKIKIQLYFTHTPPVYGKQTAEYRVTDQNVYDRPTYKASISSFFKTYELKIVALTVYLPNVYSDVQHVPKKCIFHIQFRYAPNFHLPYLMCPFLLIAFYLLVDTKNIWFSMSFHLLFIPYPISCLMSKKSHFTCLSLLLCLFVYLSLTHYPTFTSNFHTISLPLTRTYKFLALYSSSLSSPLFPL
jgi:hypothetical protein